MNASTGTPGAVVADTSKTRKVQIAMGVTALVGIGLVVASLGIGYVLVLGGVGGIAAMHFVGGAGTASCPSCASTFAVMQTRRRRVAPCPSCGLWLAGADQMAQVKPDTWEKRPTFSTRLPETFAWGTQCGCCDAPADRQIVVKSVPKPGLVLPVATVTSIEVPVCSRHADPDTNIWIHRNQDGAAISFRSLASMQRFAEQNGLTAQDSASAFWTDTEAARPIE